MPYELYEIKEMRKRSGLTQKELARRADVSQSLVAKIESGRIDPAFTNVKRIFNVLNEIAEKREVKAKSLMNKNIIKVRANDSISEATSKMRKYNISQLPVFYGRDVIGLISENTILDLITSEKPDKIKGLRISDIMKECPPVVPLDAPASAVSGLLKHYPIVLVGDKGRLKGVITKSDIIKTVSKI